MNKEKVAGLLDENVSQIEALIKEKVQIWYQHVLFTDLWWFGFMLSILPWIIWFWLRDKHSTDRLLYAGFCVAIISLVLDILGDQLGLWHYRFNVIPVLPTYFPWDLTLMPVTVMLFLQFKPHANPYVKAALFSLLTSYAAEPFVAWLLVYNPVHWNYSYSVPIQFAIYLMAHYMSRRTGFRELR